MTPFYQPDPDDFRFSQDSRWNLSLLKALIFGHQDLMANSAEVLPQGDKSAKEWIKTLACTCTMNICAKQKMIAVEILG